MEGLSAAASGIAVVSLALELTNAIRELHGFFHNVAQAPKELERLITILEEMNVLSDDIGGAAKMIVDAGDEFAAAPNFLCRLQKCQDTLQPLRKLIDEVRIGFARNKFARARESWKLARRRQDIERYEKQLEGAKTNLQFTLMGYNTRSRVVDSRKLSKMCEEVAIIQSHVEIQTQRIQTFSSDHQRSGPAQIGGQGPLLVRSANMTHGELRCTNIVLTYRTWFGVFCYRIRTTSKIGQDGSSKVLPSRATLLSFSSSLFRRRVEWLACNMRGRISHTLTSRPIVAENSTIMNSCRQGDVDGVKTQLCKGQASLFAVDECGSSLLHHAVENYHFKLCDFLLQCGLQSDGLDDWGMTPLIASIYRTRLQTFLVSLNELAAIFVSHGQGESIFQDSATILGILMGKIHAACHECGALTRRPFQGPTTDIDDKILVALAMFGNSLFNMPIRSSRKPDVVRRMLAEGADLHATVGQPGVTPLRYLMLSTDSTYESQSMGDDWLRLLASVGVNVQDYLGKEEQIQHELGNPPGTDSYRRRVLKFDLIGTPRVWSEFWSDPQGPAHLVIEEYKNFPHPGEFLIGDLYEDSELEQWPFGRVYGHRRVHLNRPAREIETDKFVSDEVAVALIQNRFYRRLDRKAARKHRLEQKAKTASVPGAWVDWKL